MARQAAQIRQLAGKVIRDGAEVIVIFKVAEKLYPATDQNCDLMDAYFRTGNPQLLSQLQDELEY